jgi:hypothetical protein
VSAKAWVKNALPRCTPRRARGWRIKAAGRRRAEAAEAYRAAAAAAPADPGAHNGLAAVLAQMVRLEPFSAAQNGLEQRSPGLNCSNLPSVR